MRNIKNKGFTLLELMLVIVIAGVLFSIGIPSYTALKNSNCLTTNTNRLIASLQFARSEAAKRNNAVSLLPRPLALGGVRDWRNGFEIVTDDVDKDSVAGCAGVEDVDGDGTCNEDAVMKIIELSCGDAAADKGLQIENQRGAAANDLTDFTYRSSGRLTNTSTGRIFKICMAGYLGTERGREVRVSNIGRPQTNLVNIATCPF
ncbi:MAG: hypothetical protein CMF40_01405 [Legionellales bacterium]|nr:hypothetical protein [Legionellales bacterium]|tara:strand:+ start:1106 stop:1717 length:612 start_codon:yes stop_codon:yes gene_type:complete